MGFDEHYYYTCLLCPLRLARRHPNPNPNPNQQLSTVGALLQLVVHGPGKYSMDESEGPVQVIALTSKGAD